MNQHIQQPAQRGDRVAARTGAASLARRQVLLQRRHQEAVATARAVCHRSQLLLARQRVRRQRRQGQQVEPLAWFAVQGVIDQQVVRAVWSGARTDRPTLAQLLDQLRPGDTLVVWNPTASAAPYGTWSTPSLCWATAASGSAASLLVLWRHQRAVQQG